MWSTFFLPKHTSFVLLFYWVWALCSPGRPQHLCIYNTGRECLILLPPVSNTGTTSMHHCTRNFSGVYYSSLNPAISPGDWCILVESLILEPWSWRWRSHSRDWHGKFVADYDVYAFIHTCLYIYPWGHIVCPHGNLRTHIINSSFNQYLIILFFFLNHLYLHALGNRLSLTSGFTDTINAPSGNCPDVLSLSHYRSRSHLGSSIPCQGFHFRSPPLASRFRLSLGPDSQRWLSFSGQLEL